MHVQLSIDLFKALIVLLEFNTCSCLLFQDIWRSYCIVLIHSLKSAMWVILKGNYAHHYTSNAVRVILIWESAQTHWKPRLKKIHSKCDHFRFKKKQNLFLMCRIRWLTRHSGATKGVWATAASQKQISGFSRQIFIEYTISCMLLTGEPHYFRITK